MKMEETGSNDAKKLMEQHLRIGFIQNLKL
jgi:hypothetical protein